MKKLLLCALLILIALPAFAAEDGFVSILTSITVPSAESGASVVDNVLTSVSIPYSGLIMDETYVYMSQLAKRVPVSW